MNTIGVKYGFYLWMIASKWCIPTNIPSFHNELAVFILIMHIYIGMYSHFLSHYSIYSSYIILNLVV